MGRPLSADEKRVILRILQADIDSAETLRQQVEGAFAVRRWAEGQPSIDIMVGESVPSASDRVRSPINRTLVVNDSGETIGFLLLWVNAGRLSALEYAWITEEPPTELPPNEWIIDEGDRTPGQ